MPCEQVVHGLMWLGAARWRWPLAAIWAPSWATSVRTAVPLPPWSPGAARAHAGVVSVLTPAEVLSWTDLRVGGVGRPLRPSR